MKEPTAHATGTDRSPAEYHRLAREIEGTLDDRAVRLAVLSSFTAEFLRPFVLVEASDVGCPTRLWVAPFGQFEPLLLDDASPLWAERPDVVAILLRLEDIDRHLQLEHARLGADGTAARLGTFVDRLVALAEAARRTTRASLLVANLAPSSLHALSPFEASAPDGFGHCLAAANRELARRLSAIGDTHVFDYAGCVAAAGAARWTDARLWHVARAACSGANQPHLARWLARAVAALVRPAAKCVVVDLDNTLWGGVLGDDGLDGIRLGDDYPGSAFKEMQAALRGLRHRGFLLALASKNDEALVRQALDTHPEMLLHTADFACLRANWEPKPGNLRAIAAALNIGLDALVFVDDNPVERAAVRAELPMVHVLDLPAEPSGYVGALEGCALFDRPRLLEEDRRRAGMYADEERRREALASAPTLDDALRDLRMVAEVGVAGSATLERIHQLIQKTNQFNLTTRRHSLDEVRRLMDLDDARVAWLRLADRYGDLGLVCVAILRRREAQVWEVDTLLMSCRVMGRRVEAAFLAYLAELVRAAGGRRLRGLFRPTAKNAPVRDFYDQHGFGAAGGSAEAERRYEVELAPGTLPWPDVIARVAHQDGARDGNEERV
jgi:FkbH-like protein